MLKYLNKHARVRVGFVRDTLQRRHRDRAVIRVDTNENKADLGTKGLGKDKHQMMLRLCGVMSLKDFQAGR